MNVGGRIRATREEKGFSLRKVAGDCGISASLLSQIETSRVDPSLSTLRKIAQALDVPVFYLVLDKPAETAGLVKKAQRRTVVFPKGGLEYEIIYSDLRKKMGIHIGTLKASGMTSEEPLAHDGEECIVILKGRMKAQVGKDLISLEVGDSFYFDSSIPHRLLNEGPTDCKFYLIITPPKF
jgi:transcriptional regulator with XRE-family HTH domain